MATARSKSTAQSRTRSKSGAAPAVAKNPQDTVESDTPLAVDSNTDMSDMERAEAEADAEDARQKIQANAETVQAQAQAVDATRGTRVEETSTGTTTPVGEPPKITEGVYGPAGTKEDPVIPSGVTPDTVPAPGGTVPEHQTVTAEAAEAVAEAAGVDVTANSAAESASFDNADQAKAPPERDLNVLKALADTSGLDPVTPYPEGGVQAPTPVPRLPILRDTHDWTREGDIGAVGRVLVDGTRLLVNGYYRFALRGDRVVAPKDVIESCVKRGTMAKESE